MREKSRELPVEKTNQPGSGSYDLSKSYNLVEVALPQITFPKSKIVKLSQEVAERKSYIPGAGSYDFDKVYERQLYRPYVRTRI